MPSESLEKLNFKRKTLINQHSHANLLANQVPDYDQDSTKLVNMKGIQISVRDFIEDANLIKSGKAPQNIKIGLQHTALQELRNEELRLQSQKNKTHNFKLDVETAKRLAKEMRKQKQKKAEIYDQLERDLAVFEIQEEN